MPSPWLEPDRWGMALAIGCALHCLLIPLLFGLVPALTVALHSFASSWRPLALGLWRLQIYEGLIVTATLSFAAISLAIGWCRHRSWLPALWLGAAASAFLLALVPGIRGPWHLLLVVTGGTATAIAHWRNLRLLRARVH